MRIELYKNPCQPVQVPLVNGVLQYDFATYLVVRYQSPHTIRSNMNKATTETMRHIANDTRMLLENLAANNIPIEDASYENHISLLLNTLANEGNWTDETYNIRYARWRDYFDYLTSRGIRTKAIFPTKQIRKRALNSEDDFLNYTKSSTEIYEHDQGHKKTGKKSNYNDRVISLDVFHKLVAILREDDPVYAVMSLVGILTLLRVGNLVQIPLHESDLNKKNWMLWPEFQRSGQNKIKFNCIGKFNKFISVDIWPSVLEIIYNQYIDVYFDERKEKFKNTYMKRKNASLNQGKVILPKDILWLTESGAPVKPYMLQAAFRKASVKLGTTVEPHFLRHSGATHLLHGYCKKQGLEPDEKLATVFHQVLKGILCHENIETTRMYIRTLIEQKAKLLIPAIHEDIRNNLESTFDPALIAATKKTIDEFYGDVINRASTMK